MTDYISFWSMQVGSKRITAHRIVLAATVPYFYAMFLNDMREATQKEVSYCISVARTRLKKHVHTRTKTRMRLVTVLVF